MAGTIHPFQVFTIFPGNESSLGLVKLDALYNYWGYDEVDIRIVGYRANYDPWLMDPDGDLVFVSSDGTGGYKDNCPSVANADQLDSDHDGAGDACDSTPFGPVGPDKPATGGGGVPGLIQVTSGQLVELSCDLANTLSLANDSVGFNQTMCGFSAKLSAETSGTLPAALPSGYTFASGLTVNLLKGTDSVQKLDSGKLTLQFPVPAGMEGKTFVILFWDAAAGKYVEVAGVSVAGGLVQATVDQPGTYILVTK